MKIQNFLEKLEADQFCSVFSSLYGADEKVYDIQKKRYRDAVLNFKKQYPDREEISIYSASGRTEIGGNHTDHQHGCVLAAAVNMDAVGIVSFHNENEIRVCSEGYKPFSVSLSDLGVHQNDSGSSEIVRGIAAKFTELDTKIGGFDVYCVSDVISGSGVSSSAAFETLFGTIIDDHYNHSSFGAVKIAQIGQYAENVYFGKESGLMDQMVSSVGGLVHIDFCDTKNPVVSGFQFDFEKAGYSLCIVDTKGSHADLTEDYVAIRKEMEQVAGCFGKCYLRDVSEADFMSGLSELQKKCHDRAILRALHFIKENKRATREAEALRAGDVERFLELVRESGASSANLLQNLYSVSSPTEQAIPLGIAISREILDDQGAVRVHGGGFAGTIQAFVPAGLVGKYKQGMESLFGEGTCHVLSIRPVGGIKIAE